MSFDSLSLGAGGVSRFSGQRGRTGDGMNRSGVRYPSPFFDIGHTYLPPSIKGLLRWCRYYYLVNPLINSVIHKMSEYPVTEIVIDEKEATLKTKWEELLGVHLRYRAFQIEVGLDYYTYGMCVVTIHFPFTKWLICGGCNHKEKAAKMAYKWRNLDYIIECPKCGHVGAAKVQDYYEKDVRRIRMVRWNPEYVNVDPQFAGADPVYTFEIPLQLRNDMLLGKKSVLDTIPDVFVEAMRRNKFISFTPDNIFVLKRPIISQKDNGFGMPLVFPVLKDTFYLQILRKAQEAIAQEHIVPLRILFPQAGSNSSDPYTTISLENWKQRIEAEIAKWKYDPNYIPIMPLPIGNESIGGDGKALMLYQEMQAWSEQIVAGMGVPREFVFGGMQYSGSNVSMRMIENSFIGYRTDHENMLNQFVIPRISNYMGWPRVSAHMRRFKMADDLQRTAFYFNLNQAQKVSNQTLLQEADFDPVVEKQRMEQELNDQINYTRKMMTANANVQGEVGIIQAKFQAEAQKILAPQGVGPDGQPLPPGGAPGEPGAPGAPGADGAGGAAPAMPGDPAGGGTTGAEGEMLDGQAVDPAMPEGSTVSMENIQGEPTADGSMPPMAMSPISMGLRGGGINLAGLAKRAVAALEKMDPMTRMAELNRMKGLQPQLYSLVLQELLSRKGSQEDPLSPVQSPLPQQKPTRRKAPVGA